MNPDRDLISKLCASVMLLAHRYMFCFLFSFFVLFWFSFVIPNTTQISARYLEFKVFCEMKYSLPVLVVMPCFEVEALRFFM